MELHGKTAVVTGGAQGIGLALARRFQAAGMAVVLADVERSALDAAVAELEADGADVLGVPCDVSRAEDLVRVRDQARERFGAAHVVCLNAGVAPVGPLLETSLETWRWLLDVNVLGVVHGVAAFGPDLVAQGEGQFVLTASAAGISSSPTLGAYSATKHAVVGLAATLRDELAPSGVGVSVLCPGLVRTRIFESERNRERHPTAGHADPAALGYLRDLIGRGVDPAAVADTVYHAVLRGDLFVIPTPDVVSMVRHRIEEMTSALPQPADPPAPTP